MTNPSLVAIVATSRDARRAVESLSMHGVDGGRIHVTDPRHGGAGRPTSDDRATDASVMRRLGTRLVQGIGVGALVGAVLGALVLLLVADDSSAALVGALGGAIGGGGIGAAAGLLSTPSMATAWEDANAPGPGIRRVVVTDVDPREEAELRALLRRHARDVRLSDPGLNDPA